MTLSVAGRVTNRLPRPIRCDACGSPRVHLQKRSLMKMRAPRTWDLIWHCLECEALVGCHEGTDIPLGLMADAETRGMRFLAHEHFDRLWRGRSAPMSRAEAYAWMARTLAVSADAAHIGMLDRAQCEQLIAAVGSWRHQSAHSRHWKQKTRKKRRK